MGKEHLPFAVLGITVFILCNVLPLLVILVYSIPTAQILLRYFPVSLHNALYPFMDSILGCYKDGTNNTRNCRPFGVVYYVVRLLIWTIAMWNQSADVFSVIALFIGICGIAVAIIQPYKSATYNTVDTILILSLGLSMTSISTYPTAFLMNTSDELLAVIASIIFMLVPLFYIVGYVTWKIRKFPKKCIRKTKLIYSQFKIKTSDEASPLINYGV